MLKYFYVSYLNFDYQKSAALTGCFAFYTTMDKFPVTHAHMLIKQREGKAHPVLTFTEISEMEYKLFTQFCDEENGIKPKKPELKVLNPESETTK